MIRRKNSFYCAPRPEQPIAWLTSRETVTLLLTDRTSGRRSAIDVRLDDIQLPAPIRIDHRIYKSLQYHLIRSSGGGVARWFNKFYSTVTGRVLAELVSPEKMRLFEAEGLFGLSKMVDLESYAIEVPRELYFHLLNFLSQEAGGEVVRAGNAFYAKQVSESLDAILRSPAAVTNHDAIVLSTKILAELVSKEEIRLPDGTRKRIGDLVLTRRVRRNHLHFCSSCQSFIQTPYRTATHESEFGKHALTYVRSHVVLVPISKKKEAKKKFPEILYRYWGVEQGKVAREGKRPGRRSLSPLDIPTAGTTALAKPRTVSSTFLLLVAVITVDGKLVTEEAKRDALQTLEEKTFAVQQDQIVPQRPSESPLELPQSKSLENATRGETVQHENLGKPRRQEIEDLPELKMEA